MSKVISVLAILAVLVGGWMVCHYSNTSLFSSFQENKATFDITDPIGYALGLLTMIVGLLACWYDEPKKKKRSMPPLAVSCENCRNLETSACPDCFNEQTGKYDNFDTYALKA